MARSTSHTVISRRRARRSSTRGARKLGWRPATELLLLGGRLQHLVQLGANVFVARAEEAVLVVVPADDPPGVDEKHVWDHQDAVPLVVPLHEFLYLGFARDARGEIRFERLEVHREVVGHALFKGDRHYLHVARRVVFLDHLQDPGQVLAVRTGRVDERQRHYLAAKLAEQQRSRLETLDDQLGRGPGRLRGRDAGSQQEAGQDQCGDAHGLTFILQGCARPWARLPHIIGGTLNTVRHQTYEDESQTGARRAGRRAAGRAAIRYPYLRNSRRPLRARRRALRRPLRRNALRPHPARILARPHAEDARHGTEYALHVLLLEPARATAGALRFQRQPGYRRLHPHRAGRGTLGDRAARPLQLRRMGVRRLPLLAARNAGLAGAHHRPALPGGGRQLHEAPAGGSRAAANYPRRPGHYDAGGKRVRLLRQGQGLPRRHPPDDRGRRSGDRALYRRWFLGLHAGRRHAARSAQRDQLRRRTAGRVRQLRQIPPGRAADVRRILGGLVRPLGREAPHRR